jgi:hypothetical protein
VSSGLKPEPLSGRPLDYWQVGSTLQHSECHSVITLNHNHLSLEHTQVDKSRMPAKYTPPHMRGIIGDNGIASNQPAVEQQEYSLKEIQYQFGNPPSAISTLNVSACAPGAYIVIFLHEHKDWPPTIFCKSNLHILPKDPTPNNHMGETMLYPIFTQLDGGESTPSMDRRQRLGRPFKFSGYHAITHIDYLQPNSDQLVSKLRAKFRGTDGTERERYEEAWTQSLNKLWAVVDFGSASEEVIKKRGLSNPMVPLKPQKGVTEALAELRLKE